MLFATPYAFGGWGCCPFKGDGYLLLLIYFAFFHSGVCLSLFISHGAMGLYVTFSDYIHSVLSVNYYHLKIIFRQ